MPGSAGCLWSARGAAADAGLGPPGRASTPTAAGRPWRSPRSAAQLRVGWHFCEPADPQAKGAVERLQGFCETQLRARPPVRQRARLPGPARRVVRRARERADAQDAARPPDRPARRGARGDGAAAGADARHRRGAGCSGSRPIRTCASTPTTTRSIPRLVGRRVEVRVTDREVTRGRAGHRRGRLPAPAVVRQAPHDHRARARPRAEAPAAAAPRRRAGGRGPAAGPLRRADRMSRPTTELAHLFRALKAPAAARALPKLADRARAEEWSYEQFAAALLKTETDSRDSHGGQARIKAARFPARKTLEEFDFAFQTSLRRDTRPAPRPARLPRRQGERRPARPARHRQDPPLDRARDPRLPRRPPRPVPHRDRMGRAARRRPTPRPPRHTSSTGSNGSRC